MGRRIPISIIAIIALVMNSVCLCAAASVCSGRSCATHAYHGTCPAYQRNDEAAPGDDCCQTAACGSSVAIKTDTDSEAANHLDPPPVVSGRLLGDFDEGHVRLALITAVPSLSFALPVFLLIHALLL
jgi:hypothetical protein